MKISDLLKEKAAMWVRAEKNSLDCLWVTDVEQWYCAGPCTCCGEEDYKVAVTFETPKFPDQTFYGHIHIVYFNGSLQKFIEHLDKKYE